MRWPQYLEWVGVLADWIECCGSRYVTWTKACRVQKRLQGPKLGIKTSLVRYRQDIKREMVLGGGGGADGGGDGFGWGGSGALDFWLFSEPWYPIKWPWGSGSNRLAARSKKTICTGADSRGLGFKESMHRQVTCKRQSRSSADMFGEVFRE